MEDRNIFLIGSDRSVDVSMLLLSLIQLDMSLASSTAYEHHMCIQIHIRK